MSKEESLIKKFVEENCLLFTLTIPTISDSANFYLSFYNLDDENIKKLYDFFFEGEKDLFISQDDDELEDEKYLFPIEGIPQIQINKRDLIEREIIKEICKNVFPGRLLLINDIEGNFYFSFDLDKTLEDDSKDICGICCFENTQIDLSKLKQLTFILDSNSDIKGKEIYDSLIQGNIEFNEEKDDEKIGEKEEEEKEEDEEIKEGSKEKKDDYDDEIENNLNKKRNRNKIPYDKIREITTSFIAKLRVCVELDNKNRKINKPSLNKLKILPAIRNFLANIYYQKEFLAQDGLEILQEWLIRNPDGTYPPLNQIRSMLDSLDKLNSIQTRHLKKCQIGGCVMDLSKNTNFPNDIQRKAKNLVAKWLRIIYGITIDYGDFETGNQKYLELINKGKSGYYYEDESINEEDEDEEKKEKFKENLEMKNDIFKENEIYNRSKVPKKGMFDFVKKPISKFDENKVDDTVKNYSYFDLKRRKKK